MTTALPGTVCISEAVGTLSVYSPALDAMVSLNTPAWGIPDLSTLRPGVFDTRGANVTIPGASGRRALPQRVDQADRPLGLFVSGVCDQDGVPYDDDENGLLVNLAYLAVNVFEPPTPPVATVTATLDFPDLDELTAEVQFVGGFVAAYKNRGYTRGTINLRIPAGRFA